MDKIVNLSLARKSVPTLIDVVQGATAPNIVFVLEDYTPPSNARARLYIKKTNAEVYNDCVLSGNQVTYTPTAGSFDEEGQCVAQLEIVQGNTIAVSWRIFVTVEPNLIEGSAAPASTEYGALESLIINAQQYDTIIGANNLTGANNRQGWTALTSGQDINEVTTAGVYYAQTNVLAQSLVNSPYKYAFKLVVEHSLNGNGYLKQSAYLAGWVNGPLYQGEAAETFIWRKSINGGTTWSEWIDQPQRSEVNTIANQGAKNLLNNNGVNTKVHNGITFTKNADGSVTATGTATANATYDMTQVLDVGRYTLTGCPSGGSTSTYNLTITTTGSDIGDGITFNQTSTQNRTIRIYILPAAGEVNLTFYPMIRDSVIQDDTFVPYGMTNAELTEEGMVEKGLMPTPTSDLDILHLPQGTYKVNVAAGIVTSGYLPARYGTLTIIRGKDTSTGDYVSAIFCVALSSNPSVYFRTGLDSPSNPNWITAWLKMATA